MEGVGVTALSDVTELYNRNGGYCGSKDALFSSFIRHCCCKRSLDNLKGSKKVEEVWKYLFFGINAMFAIGKTADY